ncbi:MAG TPA: phospholipid carrier-dependent glycosyltransferase [Bryobacteraceae bacterium]|nr:phospholipid carrier-dependent glycosyltransferase [Bryobacteraceae bacterium]
MPARIWVFWALFLVRGAFYSSMLPLWEGWDEYAHFAYIQHWNEKGTLPRAGDRISREIDESMRAAPLPHELSWIGAPYLTHEQWWALPEAERAERRRTLSSIPPSLAFQAAEPLPGRPPFVFYEAQQPPLYYWLAAPVAKSIATMPIAKRVPRLRLLSVLFASLAIPFTFLTARAMSGSVSLAGCAAALLAIAPGLAIDASHVANDGLAIGLSAIFLWLLAREETHWALAGIVLGAAILTKASLLVLALVLVLAWFRKPKRWGLALGLAAAIGGWWYVRNVLIGVPLTGWQESVPLNVLAASALRLIRTGRWIGGAQTVAKSFTWFGAWSFLTLRTWMYLVLEFLALAGMIAGLAMKRNASVRIAVLFTVCFACAVAAGAAAYDAVHGIPGIPGWYLWPAGGAMAILIAVGYGRLTAFFAALLALADLFGAGARMLPYYAGLAPWNHGSVTQAFEAWRRLQIPVWLVAIWLIATAGIPLLVWQAYGREKTRM